MNKERMKILAAVLNGAGLPQGFKFQMAHFYNVKKKYDTKKMQEVKCGTAGCIAGLAVHLFGDREVIERYYSNDEFMEDDPTAAQARKILGLTAKEARGLFMADGIKLDNVKQKNACAVVNHAIKTGKIDWKKAGLPASAFDKE